MSEKKVPPPPALPPTIGIKENYCRFHKGDLQGDLYTCPSCKEKYCLECAKKAKSEGKKCIKCQQLIFIKE